MLIFKKKFKNESHEFCPFCGEREEPFLDINPYNGEIELELIKDENLKTEFEELHSINLNDFALP